jgi:hypothetical protein
MKKRRIYTAVLAAVLAVTGLGVSSATARPRPVRTTTAATTVKTAGAVTATGGAYTISGLDLHDGTVYKDGSTYYLVGTQYGCGFQWRVNSNFCGFAVSSSTSLAGPWSAPAQLFPPSSADPVGGTWQSSCAQNGSKGCFNPRMIKRSDGVWVLWFNDVAHQTTSSNNAYVTMGCNGPAGPCGATAGAPYGSTHLPTLHQCNGNNGDFGLISDTTGYALICTYAGHLSEEHLDKWLTNGANTGIGWPGAVGGATEPVEGPGAFQRDDGTWIMTFSDPQCGYCSGTRAGYATAPSMMGPWATAPNVGFGQPVDGRHIFSAASCGGQPRTVGVVDGQPYEWYDIWYGSRNETNAQIVLDPLTVNSGSNVGSPDGSPLVPLISGSKC